MTQLPTLDAHAMWKTLEARVDGSCLHALPLVRQLRDRLSVDRWMLEWHLPWWIGLAYRLHEDVCKKLVLGNVLGMAALRLEDDLADGEADLADEQSTRRASHCLYDLALAAYRDLLPVDSPFWSELDGRMAEWRTADTAAAGTAELAKRGAPLKVSAFAVCELSNRQDAYPVLDDCLDHALTAIVMFDHYRDWELDLAAGRWNTFVERALAGSELLASRTRVYATMMTGDPIGPYFATIDRELREAAVLADDAGVRALADHFRRFAADLARDGLTAQAHYRGLGERSQAVMFGSQQA